MAFHASSSEYAGSAEWASAISSSFFDVSTQPLSSRPFAADLHSWRVGDVLVSVHSCDAVRYLREASHIRRNDIDYVLVTFPLTTPLRFRQDDRDLTCGPGTFFLQLSGRAYEFIQDSHAEMWSLLIPDALLRHRLLSLDKFVPYAFDTETGIGALLFDLIKGVPQRVAAADANLARGLGKIIVDLLVLALESNPNVLGRQLGGVQTGHIARIENHIRRHLADPTTTPENVAAACGISPRYLHRLFRDTGTTVGRWILDRRLDACDEDLKAVFPRRTVSEIAFRWGFSDHAHFSRQYKRRFGLTPRARRLEAASADR